MHKMVFELKKDDKFLMAGNHFKVIELRETVNPDMLKIVFTHVGHSNVRFYLSIAKTQLFSLT